MINYNVIKNIINFRIHEISNFKLIWNSNHKIYSFYPLQMYIFLFISELRINIYETYNNIIFI